MHYNKGKGAADQTVNAIHNSNGSAESIQFDITNFNQVRSALNIWKQQIEEGYISVLVNNAGISHDNLMIWMKIEEWSKVINTNLDSFFYVFLKC